MENQIEENTETNPTSEPTLIKRGRGRPKGSKNKPRPDIVAKG